MSWQGTQLLLWILSSQTVSHFSHAKKWDMTSFKTSITRGRNWIVTHKKQMLTKWNELVTPWGYLDCVWSDTPFNRHKFLYYNSWIIDMSTSSIYTLIYVNVRSIYNIYAIAISEYRANWQISVYDIDLIFSVNISF
jgi:hypothetical protein